MTRIRTMRNVMLAAVTGLMVAFPGSALAQGMDGSGAVATGLLLRQMEGVKRVLMIGAHPDDEDTGLLTHMARGFGAETAYLALTRGDGGQNLIGPELWEGLGIIRTGELEAARSLDGGRQFFTRAFDFGYSKTAEEALSLWPREDLLREVVWVVRKFRPHVIVSVFSGTPRDGHGQHQAAGIMAREVFAAAGDPTRFPEQLAMGVEAWAPAKLYQSTRRRFAGDEPPADGELIVQIGTYDPLLGRSHFQLSMASRSMHRSQDMGAAQPLGPRSSGVTLVESRVDGASGFFTGIDTTLVGVAAGAPAVVAHLNAYRASVASARADFGLDPATIAPWLADALGHLHAARDAAGADAGFELLSALDHKIEVATRALMGASGIVVDVRAAEALLVPGQPIDVGVQVWNGGERPVAGVTAALSAPAGWSQVLTESRGLGPDGSIAPGQLGVFTYRLSVPATADPSRLYFLREPRQGPLYQWPNEPGLWGLPRDPALVSAVVGFAAPGMQSQVAASTAVPWRYVGVDQARGEFVKPVLIVPAVSVQVAPKGLVWPQGRMDPGTITVVVSTAAEAGASGVLSLEAPTGWTASPASRPFELVAAGAERALTFEVRAGTAVQAGEHAFRAVATVGSRSYREGYSLIDYEHIERALQFADATTEVTVVPVRVTEGLRVGYIMGTGDDGPLAIQQMGAQVDLLTEAQVRDGAFDGFDVIVLGVRAYEARADLRAANAQLLDFARAGGTVVNQYNQFQYSAGGYPPHPLEVGRDRVADETAPMRIMEPGSPVFTTPNQISQDDFSGWVQERGLYFPSEWSEDWTPLLEMNDPGEDPTHGSLLVTRVGEGVYVHVSLSFFRQWSGRVPGAFRLFANLISLDPQAWAAFEQAR